jgi:transcriptional regulator with XRE-family HTH domain
MANTEGMKPMAESIPRAGDCLRRLRNRLGLTTRRVAEFSREVAAKQGNNEYAISHARLVQIEKQASIPSVYKLFTLSCIYGVPVDELIAAYLNPDAAARLHVSMQFPQTHLASFGGAAGKKAIPFPVHFNSTSPVAGNNLVAHIVQVWGEVPAPLLESLNLPGFRYGFIGLRDYTMYPLIRPGSVVQIDHSQKVARSAQYRTEFDRPIYFLETRSGYLCSWCEIGRGHLTSIPHPLSSCSTQVFAYPSEVEIVGRVTGVAVRLVREDDAPDRRKTEHDANGLGLKDGAMKDGVMKDAALLGLAGLRAAAITTG